MVKKAPITDDNLLRGLGDAAKPIDFEALIKAGIIEKDGDWYRVPDLSALPTYAARKIQKRKVTKKGVSVKFREPRSDIVALDKKLNRKTNL